MSDFSFNNDSNIELDIDIENILESLENNSEKSDINNSITSNTIYNNISASPADG